MSDVIFKNKYIYISAGGWGGVLWKARGT